MFRVNIFLVKKPEYVNSRFGVNYVSTKSDLLDFLTRKKIWREAKMPHKQRKVVQNTTFLMSFGGPDGTPGKYLNLLIINNLTKSKSS